MKATEAAHRRVRELTPRECWEIDREIRAVVDPYVQAAVRLLSLSIPTITATRDAETQRLVVSTSYPPEVEACLAQYLAWQAEAVELVKQRWGVQ